MIYKPLTESMPTRALAATVRVAIERTEIRAEKYRSGICRFPGRDNVRIHYQEIIDGEEFVLRKLKIIAASSKANSR